MNLLQTESNHDTALTLACAGGHEELVQTLLERGASIEHRDKKGRAYFCEFFSFGIFVFYGKIILLGYFDG